MLTEKKADNPGLTFLFFGSATPPKVLSISIPRPGRKLVALSR